MLIGGIQKFSLLDYPKKTATVIFTQGCPFRCHYCHNAELVLPEHFTKTLLEDAIFDFLTTRINKIDAVVISGGEPTMQSALPLFIERVKKLGFLIKLDTSGINPHMIEFLLKKGLLDYIAMDLKAPLSKYTAIVGRTISTEKIQRSIDLILHSSINHEFRTTVVDELHSFEDVIEMAKCIKGAKLYALQRFVSKKTLNPEYKQKISLNEKILEELKVEAKKHVKECIIR